MNDMESKTQTALIIILAIVIIAAGSALYVVISKAEHYQPQPEPEPQNNTNTSTTPQPPLPTNPDAQTACSPESRTAQVCTAIYQPVCGWMNPAKIQCFAYPCAQTYPNSCEACKNDNIISWTQGECPPVGSG